jgi:aspartate aminotransferase
VLDAAGIAYSKPEGAFYIFAKVPPRKVKPDADGGDGAFVQHLKESLILGVQGSAFGAAGYLRFAYCVNEKNIRDAGVAFKRAISAW